MGFQPATGEHDFDKSGNFLDGTIFTHLGGQWWNLTCPVCSCDEFVQNGTCTGIFKSRTGALMQGTKPCRCAKTPHWTQSQREHQANEILRERGFGTKFVEWETHYERNTSKIVLECPRHGNFTIGFNKFLLTKNGCPACARGGYNPKLDGALYVILAQGFSHSFTGFGISNDFEKRLSVHKYNLGRAGYKIAEMELYKGEGYMIKDIELQILRTFERHSQCIEGFRKEATYWYNYEEVLDFVESKLAAQT